MSSVRSLFFDIFWNMNTRELREANRMTDELRDNTRQLGGDLTQSTRSMTQMNREMRQMSYNSSDSARQSMMQFRQMNNELRQFARNSAFNEVNSSMSVLQTSIAATNTALTMMGFGQTKAQVQALEGQLYNLANVRTENLNDQIMMLEKSIKQMKSSAKSGEMTEQIQASETLLEQYRQKFRETQESIRNYAEQSGYTFKRIFGKEVLVKPFDSAFQAIRGRMFGFLNQDLAFMANRTYQTIDRAAKAIIGPTDTIAQQRQKIAQLATAYQTLGTTINSFVTPVIIAATAGIAVLGSKYEDMVNRFQAQTLTADVKMPQISNDMVSAWVDTGAAFGDIGNTFSYFRNQLRIADKDLKDATTTAFTFADAFNQGNAKGMIDMYSGLTVVTDKLKVSKEQAADMMAISLRNNQGDANAATKEILEQAGAYRKVTAAGKEGSRAFENMQAAMNNGAMGQFGQALRQTGAALLELYNQLQPTLIIVANGITSAANAATNFLKNNPGFASFAAHALMIGGAITVMIGAFAPLAGALIRFRGLFQVFGQSISGAMLGGRAVTNPAAAAMVKSFQMVQKAIIGLPRIIAGVFPAMLTILRAAPMAIFNFARAFVMTNPWLLAFAALGIVVYRSWDRIGPILSKMWADVKMAFAPVFAIFSQANSTLWPTAKKLLGQLADAAGNQLVKGLQMLAPLVTKAAQAINHVLSATIKGIASWWKQDGPMIIQAAQNVMNGLIAAFKFILPVLKPIFAIAKSIIAGAWENIKAVFTSGVGIIKNVLSIFGALFTGNWSKLWQNVKSLVVNGITFVWNLMQLVFLGRVVGAARAGMALMRGFVASGWAAIKAVFTSVVTSIKSFFATNFNGILKTTESIMNGMRAVFWAVWGAIKSFISSSIAFVRSVINTGMEAIKKIFSTAWNAIKTTLSNVLTTIKGLIKTFIDGAVNIGKNFLTGVANGFKSNITKVIAAAQEVWDSVKRIFSSEQTVSVNVQGNVNGGGETPRTKMAWGGVFHKATDIQIGEDGKEYAIPVEPGKRNRGLYLLSQAARDLGVPLGVQNTINASLAMPRGERPSLAISSKEAPNRTSGDNKSIPISLSPQFVYQGGNVDEAKFVMKQEFSRMVDQFFADKVGER